MNKRILMGIIFVTSIFFNIFPAYSNECDDLNAFGNNSCGAIVNEWTHCVDRVLLYAENPPSPYRNFYAHWKNDCEISLTEFEFRFETCRIDLLKRCGAVYQQGEDGGEGNWTRTQSTSGSQENNIEEAIGHGFLSVKIVFDDFQNSPTAPHRVQTYQTSVTRWRFDQGIQQIEKQIFETNQQNEAFEIKLNEVQHKYRDLISEIETEIQKHQEKQLESLREHFQEQRASINKWVDRLNSENSITSNIEDFRSKLAHLYENEKFEELYNLLYKTQVEVAHLKGQRLPERVVQYASLREELLSYYFNEDGIITFLSDAPSFFPSGTLQSDKNSLEGQEIRHQINRGIIAYHNTNIQPTEKDRIALAMAFLGGADKAASQGELALAYSLLEIGKTLIDVTLGFIPIAGEIYDISNIISGILTGHDLLGRPMEGWDYVLSSVSVVVPFLSSSHVKLIKSGFKARETFVTNPFPESRNFSRVVSEDTYKEFINKSKGSLHKQGARPFITATEDLEKIQKHDEMIKKLGFDGDSPTYKEFQSGPLYELEIIPKNEKAMAQFELRTPIISDYDNFIGKGRTSGGAREWDMKNLDFAPDPNSGDKVLFPEGYVRSKQILNESPNPQDALGTLRVKRVINKP